MILAKKSIKGMIMRIFECCHVAVMTGWLCFNGMLTIRSVNGWEFILPYRHQSDFIKGLNCLSNDASSVDTPRVGLKMNVMRKKKPADIERR